MGSKNINIPSSVEQRRKFLQNAIAATAAVSAVPTAASAALENQDAVDDVDAIAAHVDPYVNITDSSYGADPTGSANCTGALALALAAGSDISIPPGTYLVSSNFTVPNGKRLRFSVGAKFNVSSGITLTIRGEVAAPKDVQIFSGLGSVVGIRQVYPEWWGAVGNGTGDDWQALTNAHTCVIQSQTSDGRRPTIFLSGNYQVTKTWTIAPSTVCALAVIGTAVRDSQTSRVTASSLFSNSLSNAVVNIVGNTSQQIVDWEFKNIAILPSASGYGAATIGLLIGSTNNNIRLQGFHQNLVEDVLVQNFPICLQVTHARLIKFSRCSFWNDGISVANNPVYLFANGWFTGDLTFEDCQVVGTTANTTVGIYLTAQNGSASVAGIKFRNIIVYACQKLFYVHASSGAMVGDLWIDSGSQLAGNCTNSFYVESTGAGTIVRCIHLNDVYMTFGDGDQIVLTSTGSFGYIVDVFIHNCFIYQGSSRAINVTDNGGGTISGVQINNNTIVNNNNTTGPAIDLRAIGVMCSGNVATSFGAGGRFKYFIQIGACQNVIVVNNNSMNYFLTSSINDVSGAISKIVGPNL